MYVRCTNLTNPSLKHLIQPTAHARTDWLHRTWTLALPHPPPPFWLSPHVCGHISKVLGIPRGEYNVIQSVVEWLIALHSNPCPGLCNNSMAYSSLCVYCTNVTLASLIPIFRPQLTHGMDSHSSSPPSWLSPHFCGRILKVFGMLRGEFNIIQGIIKWLITLAQNFAQDCLMTPGPTPFCAYIVHILHTLH